MNKFRSQSKLNSVLPIALGLIVGGLIIALHMFIEIRNVFIKNLITVLIIWVGIVSGVILLRSALKPEKGDIELWEELRKENKFRTILHDTFSGPLVYFVAVILGGLLFSRDYLQGKSYIENVCFYLLPLLMITSVQFITSMRTWNEMERAYMKRRSF